MTTYEELMQLIKARRSTRSFTEEPVDRSDVERLVEAARWAPSAYNLQAWKFVAYDDRDFIWKLAAEVGVALRHKISGLPRVTPEIIVEAVARATHFAKAPCILIVMHQRSKPGAPGVLPAAVDLEPVAGEMLSAAMAIENLLLAARAAKIGACVMTAPLAVREVFDSLPEKPKDYDVTCVIALGHTTENPPAPQRKGLEHILQFGQGK
jgi:nitroreductase